MTTLGAFCNSCKAAINAQDGKELRKRVMHLAEWQALFFRTMLVHALCAQV